MRRSAFLTLLATLLIAGCGGPKEEPVDTAKEEANKAKFDMAGEGASKAGAEPTKPATEGE